MNLKIKIRREKNLTTVEVKMEKLMIEKKSETAITFHTFIYQEINRVP